MRPTRRGCRTKNSAGFSFRKSKTAKVMPMTFLPVWTVWLVAKGAPKETVDFMKVWLGKEIQDKLAAEGLDIPMVKGTADVIKEPFLKQIAQEAANSQWIAIAIDQLLGPDTGRVFNDASADIAAGNMTAEKAAKTIETVVGTK